MTSETTLSNYILIVDAYSKTPTRFSTEIITTEEMMDKLDRFQPIFGKIDKFGWWDLERISADTGTQFTIKDFKDECQTYGVHLTLLAMDHQEMNRQVEVTWRTLRTVAHSLMVHARVWKRIFIFHSCIHQIIHLRFYQSKIL